MTSASDDKIGGAEGGFPRALVGGGARPKAPGSRLSRLLSRSWNGGAVLAYLPLLVLALYAMGHW